MTDRTCLIDGCEDPLAARGWCRRHYNRWYHAGDPAVPPERAECVLCGATIPPKTSRTGPRSPYCSRQCRNRAGYARQKSSGGYQRHLDRQRKPKAERSCIECQSPFMAKRADSHFCSLRCAQIRRDRINPCCSVPDCDRGVRAKGLCSMHWRRSARAEGRETLSVWDERRLANWQKRVALKKGAPHADQIVNRVIFDRDGWVCGLCSEPVDSDLAWPDPLSASLDHILPLSKGGSHVPANVQLAHLGCNVRKGARIAV